MLAINLRPTAGCQASSVIVGDHREQARSYRVRVNGLPFVDNFLGALFACADDFSAGAGTFVDDFQ